MPTTHHLLRAASVVLTIALAVPIAASAQQPAGPPKPGVTALAGQPLTNARVIAMVKKGMPEEAVLQAIRTGNNRFELDTNSVMALAQSGVSRRIIDEMKAVSPDAPRGLATTRASSDRRDAEPKKKMCVAVWCW